MHLFCGGYGGGVCDAGVLSGHPAVPGKPAHSLQVYVSLIKIKMSEGQPCTKSTFINFSLPAEG